MWINPSFGSNLGHQAPTEKRRAQLQQRQHRPIPHRAAGETLLLPYCFSSAAPLWVKTNLSGETQKGRRKGKVAEKKGRSDSLVSFLLETESNPRAPEKRKGAPHSCDRDWSQTEITTLQLRLKPRPLPVRDRRSVQSQSGVTNLSSLIGESLQL